MSSAPDKAPNSSVDLAHVKRRMSSMAIVDGTPNPDQNTQNTQVQPGSDGNNGQQQPNNDGNRADTNRAGQQPAGQQPQDGDQRRGSDGKVYTFKEDRGNWVPPHRLSEETGKRTKLEQQLADAQAKLEMSDKKLRIAFGLEVPSKEDQEAQEIREALYKVNPKLKLLERLDEETIERLLGAADSATTAVQAQWNRHRDNMLSTLQEEASDLLGVDKLSEKQAARLARAFREEAREQAAVRARAERSQDATYDYANDFVSRYERGDKTLLQEFAKSFIEDWGIPARRQANASAFERTNRPVPRGGRTRTHVTQGMPKIDYNDDKAFKDAMLKARSGGGEV